METFYSGLQKEEVGVGGADRGSDTIKRVRDEERKK